MKGTAAAQRVKDALDFLTPKLQVCGSRLRRLLSLSLADGSVARKRALSAVIHPWGLAVASGSRFLGKIEVGKIKTYHFPEGFPQPDCLASTLAGAILEMKAKGMPVSLCVPKSWSLIKKVEMPLLVQGHLPDVVSFELDRLTPFTPESALYDFRSLGTRGETLGITVFAVKALRVTPYLHALREKGVSVDSISISSCGLGTLCRYIDGGEDTVFIDIDDHGYEGGVISGRTLIDGFSGIFNGGGERVNVDRVIEEAGKAVGVLERDGKKPRLVLLAANTPYADALKSRLSIPLTTVTMSGGANGRKLRIPEAGGERVQCAIGSLLESLWPSGAGVNLLSRGRMTKRRTPVTLTLLLVAFLVAVATVYVAAPLKVEERRLQEIEHQIRLRKEEVKKVEALKKELEGIEAETAAINAFKGNRLMMLAILKELTTILPRNVWLSRIHVAENKVELEGYASSATEVLAKLEASSFFQKVEFSSPTQKDPRLNADRFAVRMELEGAAKDDRKGATGERKK